MTQSINIVVGVLPALVVVFGWLTAIIAGYFAVKATLGSLRSNVTEMQMQISQMQGMIQGLTTTVAVLIDRSGHPLPVLPQPHLLAVQPPPPGPP